MTKSENMIFDGNNTIYRILNFVLIVYIFILIDI